MRARIDAVGEQFDHAIAAEFFGRQADVVDYQQADFRVRRAFVIIRRGDEFSGIEQSGGVQAHVKIKKIE